jgi:uncharacterized protein with HEPN domain
MSERSDSELLADTKEAVIRVNDYIENLSYEQFLEDKKTQDAVVRNLEIIGEAAKNISEELKTSYPQIPWKDLAGVRDKLIHHYFGVNFDIVWNIVKQELPQVFSQIEEILKTEYNQQE